ncbi:MAG: ABC transporter permease [Spirochaetota bacterium]
MSERSTLKKTGAFLADNFILVAFFVIIAIFSIFEKGFYSGANVVEMLLRVAITAPIALGIMLAIILKGIDLSPGTTLGMVGLTVAATIQGGGSLGIALALALGVGLAIGSLNGLLISKFNIAPFIATLAVQFIGHSIERGWTKGGLPIYLYRNSGALADVYRGSVLGLPIPILLLAAIALAYYLLLEKTIFGRRLYACGFSVKGAMNAGINVRFYHFAIYVISALSSTVSGVIVASQVRSGQPLVGGSFLWDAIGAAFLSTLLSKRSVPNVLGTIIGALLFSVIASGLTFMGLSFYWKMFFRGLIILLILLAAAMRKK